MRDLSLHVLDLAQNSITAGAKLVTVSIVIDERGWLTFTLADDGKGMSPELLARVTSPVATTRTTRKVGLGIPLMMENAQRTGGDLTIQSEVGVGTTLTVTMDTTNIDCLPLGDLAGTMLSLMLTNPLT
ncbi:MAG: sensor histidine kinase, partial [Clostridia bacterium]|nr:sensor histidine kinase [Clostridia bacterium]